MKKIFLSVLAIAALAACSKSEVVLDHENEIGIVPSTKNITKISGSTGALASTQELGIWAYWDNDGVIETVSDYSKYNSNYLVNALFANKSGYILAYFSITTSTNSDMKVLLISNFLLIITDLLSNLLNT